MPGHRPRVKHSSSGTSPRVHFAAAVPSQRPRSSWMQHPPQGRQQRGARGRGRGSMQPRPHSRITSENADTIDPTASQSAAGNSSRGALGRGAPAMQRLDPRLFGHSSTQDHNHGGNSGARGRAPPFHARGAWSTRGMQNRGVPRGRGITTMSGSSHPASASTRLRQPPPGTGSCSQSIAHP
jgi:hypothetical protein